MYIQLLSYTTTIYRYHHFYVVIHYWYNTLSLSSIYEWWSEVSELKSKLPTLFANLNKYRGLEGELVKWIVIRLVKRDSHRVGKIDWVKNFRKFTLDSRRTYVRTCKVNLRADSHLSHISFS